MSSDYELERMTAVQKSIAEAEGSLMVGLLDELFDSLALKEPMKKKGVLSVRAVIDGWDKLFAKTGEISDASVKTAAKSLIALDEKKALPPVAELEGQLKTLVARCQKDYDKCHEGSLVRAKKLLNGPDLGPQVISAQTLGRYIPTYG